MKPLSNPAAAVSTGTAASPAPLPVLDICNNLITVTGYLGAIGNATAPSAVSAANPGLATQYADWQELVWDGVYAGLLNDGIMAEAEMINNLINDGITSQDAFQPAVMPSSGPVPTVISLCDDLVSQINGGLPFVSQMETIAQDIKHADQSQIAELNSIITQLNSQFDSLEQQISDKAIDNGETVVVTLVNVGVAVAEEKDPISPLVTGIAQVGTDIIKELVLSAEINATLLDLENLWSQLDDDTIQLGEMKVFLKRLKAVTDSTQATVTALNQIVQDWQTIADLITADVSAHHWKHQSLPLLAEWAARMCRVSFVGQYSQRVS